MKQVSLSFFISFIFLNSFLTNLSAQCTNPVGSSNFLTFLASGSGTPVSTATDLHAGAKVLKQNAIYSQGVWYDAVITIITENVPTGECSIAPATSPDNGNLKLSNIQPDENPYITYNITFVVAGSATAATPNGTPVIIPQARIALQDIDGAGTGVGRNYTDIGGYSSTTVPTSLYVGSSLVNAGFFAGGPASGFTTYRTPAAPSASVSVTDINYHIIFSKASYTSGDFLFGTTRDASLNPGVASVIAQRLIFHEFVGDCLGVLPVKLSSFDVDVNSCKVNLHWTSEQETNLDRYVIEYSIDGIQFVEAGSVQPFGTSKNYSFEYEPAAGKGFYRLKIKDKDGTIAFSKVVSADMKCATTSFSIYTNPVVKLTLKRQ